MSYTLQLDPTHTYLDLHYHGMLAVAQRTQAMDETVQILRDSGVRRILIDLTQAKAADEPVEHFSAFATRITSEPLLLQSRTAFVAPRVHYINYMIEVLADARHYPFSRFTEREAALAWLLGDAPPLGLD